MACGAECLGFMTALAFMLLAAGIETMRITIVQFVNIFYEVIARVAFAAESLRMMAGSTIFPSKFGGELMFVPESGLMKKRANLILPGMACGASGRGSNAVVTSETRPGVPHRRVICGIQRSSFPVDIGMTRKTKLVGNRGYHMSLMREDDSPLHQGDPYGFVGFQMTEGTVIRGFYHGVTFFAVFMCRSILILGKLAGRGSMTGSAADFSFRKMRLMVESDAQLRRLNH
jgi:hypothetical protein